MKFNRLKSILKNFYGIFIAPPKQWRLPKKGGVLIYDACGAEVLAPYLIGYSVEIIPSRGKSVNVPCLLRAILKLSFWRGNPIQSYAEAFIEVVSPKLVITYIDNDVSFYTISNRFQDIKTIFLQNGSRSEMGDIFGHLVKSESYHVDYMFVHGSAIGRHYQKFISGQVIAVGSLKSNQIKKSAKVVVGSILFISQYHDKPEGGAPFWIEPDGTPIYWDQFFAAEVQALNFLSQWCAENNKLLQICGRRTDKDCLEKGFYADCLKECVWEYIPRSSNSNSFELVDAAELVVFIDSTLGYESIGRGNKTASFSCRGSSLNNAATKFGWPTNLPDNGPFWTNDADERQFQRVMDYLNTVSAEEWEQTRQLYASELMEFDAGNTRFVALLAQLLPNLENLNHAQ